MANTITIHALSSMPAEHTRPWHTVLVASLAHSGTVGLAGLSGHATGARQGVLTLT